VISGTYDVPKFNITWNSTVSAETISHDNGTYISILQFDPLQESHRDHYQCSVVVADIVEEKIFNLNVQGNFSEYSKTMHNIISIMLILLYSTKNLCHT
jgi:hypothetical protein